AGAVLTGRHPPADGEGTRGQLAEPLLSVAGGEGRSRIVLRVLLAAVLLLSGLAVLLFGHSAAALLRPLGGVALVIAAIVVGFGPWWLRIARDLVLERQARARAEERTDMAPRGPHPPPPTPPP